jgi:HAMP domain-containing protein
MMETLVAILAVLGADLLQRLHRLGDRRGSACHRLRRLFDATQAIIRTSDEIDEIDRDSYRESELADLRRLFDKQSENVKDAIERLGDVMAVLEIKAPQVALRLAERLTAKDVYIHNLNQAARNAEHERVAAMSLGLSSFHEIRNVDTIIDALIARVSTEEQYSREDSRNVMDQLRTAAEDLRFQLATSCGYNEL